DRDPSKSLRRTQAAISSPQPQELLPRNITKGLQVLNNYDQWHVLRNYIHNWKPVSPTPLHSFCPSCTPVIL
uniref:Uncharacterized protein n=1 Tax=Mustela putorius furo TaxID=9669 RepID=M3XN38_MUSPF